MRKRSLMAAAIATWLTLGGAPLVAAAAYPDHALKLVVPYGPGGSPDRLGRAFAEALSAELQQPVVVTNMPGAGANIGHQFVANAPADGYTLLFTATGPMAISPHLNSKLSFKYQDFTPVVALAEAPAMLVTRTAAPWRSVADLVSDARARHGKISFGSTGNGTTNHLAGVLFESATKTELLHVPHKESAQAITSTIAGAIDLMFYQPAIVQPLIQADKLRALAVTSRTRIAAAPNVPTFIELGYPDLAMTVWSAVIAPAKLDPAVRQRLTEAADRAVRSTALQKLIRDSGDVPLPISAAELPKFFASEYARWGQLVKASGATAD